ncbi:MAG: hemerythrin domain-containing protein [Acidobacteriota bacterium]
MTFLTLITFHQNLNELFIRHQEALLDGDIEAATDRLDEFIKQLREHMDYEEKHLLPVYQRAGEIRGGAVEFFTGEHRKMLELLARIQDSLNLFATNPENLKRRIIKLFDEEAAFKSLVEHHDMREENILYPTLDRITTPEEKKYLLNDCLHRQAAHQSL